MHGPKNVAIRAYLFPSLVRRSPHFSLRTALLRRLGSSPRAMASRGGATHNLRPARLLFVAAMVLSALPTFACASSTNPPPAIHHIQTSSTVLATSDCIPTAVTITARITDDTGVAAATLWYRVGTAQPYTARPMQHSAGDVYSATVIALEIPGGAYGALAFSIVATDHMRAQTTSRIDTSVQLLPCVRH